MTRPHQSQAARLVAAETAIGNTLKNETITQQLAAFGYDEAMLAEGQALLETARAAVFHQEACTGKASLASADEKYTRSLAWDAYQELNKILRAIYQAEPQYLIGMELVGNTPTATAAFIKRGRVLFDNVMKDEAVLATLARYKFDAERLQASSERIEAFVKANEAHELASADRQVATKTQDDAMAILWDWYGRFRKIARVALRTNPELLENLGIRIKPRKPRTKPGP